MKKYDLRKRFLKLAYDQLNPNLSTLEGIEQALVNWYCFQYNVPPNDDKLLGMTVEELLVLRHMFMIKEDPTVAEEMNPDIQSYEDFLKEQMGKDYVSEDDMVAKAKELEVEEKEFEKRAMQDLPPVITTDFNNIE